MSAASKGCADRGDVIAESAGHNAKGADGMYEREKMNYIKPFFRSMRFLFYRLSGNAPHRRFSGLGSGAGCLGVPVYDETQKLSLWDEGEHAAQVFPLGPAVVNHYDHAFDQRKKGQGVGISEQGGGYQRL